MMKRLSRQQTMKRFSGQIKAKKFSDPLLLIAAHSDDETIGAGILISKSKSIHIAHMTHAEGFRKKELREAMKIAKVPPSRLISLGFADQKTYRHLTTATERIAKLILELEPAVILTHPYEGGHPDHDSTAFAVHQARNLISRQKGRYFPIVEFASYHGWRGRFRTGEFLPRAGDLRVQLKLSARMKKLKLRMFEKFTSQAEMLKSFGTRHEKFRLAPDYDFKKKPAQGKPIYDTFNMEAKSGIWLKEARRSMKEILKILL